MSDATKPKVSVDFINFDDSDPRVFQCSHPLLDGQMVIAHDTIGNRLAFERYASVQMGPTPTPDVEGLAYMRATVEFGFETIKGQKPEKSDVNWDNFKGKKGRELLGGLAEAVQAYWKFCEDE
jgi:hypothetical protein